MKMILQLDNEFLSEIKERYQHTGFAPNFSAELQKAVDAIKTAGFEPHEQLTGYVRTGNACYITRKGNAREMVLRLDIQDVRSFLKAYSQIP